jgi:hypothetical protein
MNLSLSNEMKKVVSHQLVFQLEKTAIQSLLSLGVDPDEFQLSQVGDVADEQSTSREKALRQVGYIMKSVGTIREQIAI